MSLQEWLKSGFKTLKIVSVQTLKRILKLNLFEWIIIQQYLLQYFCIFLLVQSLFLLNIGPAT